MSDTGAAQDAAQAAQAGGLLSSGDCQRAPRTSERKQGRRNGGGAVRRRWFLRRRVRHQRAQHTAPHRWEKKTGFLATEEGVAVGNGACGGAAQGMPANYGHGGLT